MKNTIGIATLHYGYNEGAVLQAYCSTQLIASLSDSLCGEVIDHRYPGKASIYGPASDDRKKAIADAIETWLPTSPMRFDSNDLSDTRQYINQNYSGMMVGSDQVWSLRFHRRYRVLPATQPFKFQPAFPNLYWPDAKFDVPKVGIACAVGPFAWQTTPRAIRKQMAEHLDSFALISVRDHRTLQFVKWISKSIADRTHTIPDPTILSPVVNPSHQTESAELLSRFGVTGKDSIALVAAEQSELTEALADIKAAGTSVVAMSYANPVADLDLSAAPIAPLQWANSFRSFRCVITERMHASIFAILNKTPVLAMDINETKDGTPTKISDLFRRLGISDFCVPLSQLSPQRLKQLIDRLEDGFDWEDIDKRLQAMRADATPFLNQAKHLFLGAPR